MLRRRVLAVGVEGQAPLLQRHGAVVLTHREFEEAAGVGGWVGGWVGGCAGGWP